MSSVYGQSNHFDEVDCSVKVLDVEETESVSDSVLLCYYINKLKSRDTSEYASFSIFLNSQYDTLFKQAQFQLAGQFARLQIEFGQIVQDSLAQIKGLRNLGVSYYRLGDYYKTNVAYLDALQIAELTQDSVEMAYLFRWQAWLAWRMYDPEKAIDIIGKYKQYTDALNMGIEQQYRYFNSIANFKMRKGDFREARILGDSAIHYARLLENKRSLGVALSNRSIFYSGQSTEELSWRIALVSEALKINHEMNDREQLGSNYGLIALLQFFNKDYKKSIFYYNKGLEYSKAIGDRDRAYIAYLGLSRVYDSLGMYKEAYEYELKENNLYKELYGVQNITKVLELQQEVAQASSQQQIDALVYEQSLSTLRENKIKNRYLIAFLSLLVVLISAFFIFYRKRQRQELEELLLKQMLSDQIRDLEEKTLRSQMNPHFIFNSLNSIKSHIAKSEPRIATRYLTKFAHLMRLILQNSRAPQISLSEEIKSLRLYVELEQLRLNHEFEFDLLIDGGFDPNMIMIPPMILQPYVENAIWHGLVNKKGSKKLMITMSEISGKVEIVIHDNGVGRSASKFLNDKNVSEHKSFGMQITKERIENNRTIQGMSIQIADLYNSSKTEPIGTEVKIVLPLKTKLNETNKSINY